jgi:hypothetical protein
MTERLPLLEWGVKDVGDDALAAYGARTILHLAREVVLDYVPNRTDYRQRSDSHSDQLKSAYPLLNKIACHLIRQRTFSRENRLEEYFYTPVLLIDFGRYKVFVQRAGSYMNIAFAIYDKPVDREQFMDVFGTLLTDTSLRYLKDEIDKQEAHYRRARTSEDTEEMTLTMPALELLYHKAKKRAREAFTV